MFATVFGPENVLTAHGPDAPFDAVRTLRAVAPQRTQEDPERPGTAYTRRALLAGSGTALATLALPRATRAADASRIAIVGGGIAGLTCALRLADQGIASTVYEASGRVGGRIWPGPAGNRLRPQCLTAAVRGLTSRLRTPDCGCSTVMLVQHPHQVRPVRAAASRPSTSSRGRLAHSSKDFNHILSRS